MSLVKLRPAKLDGFMGRCPDCGKRFQALDERQLQNIIAAHRARHQRGVK